jgi:uncharacterized membrane protein YecN with MAPEG domain
MATLHWVLLAFAGWTLSILLFGVGVARWSRILSGRAALTDFPADQPHGSPRYRRILRAHANAVENLPVFTAIVVVATIANALTPLMNTLGLVLIAGRVCQTLVHVLFTETNRTIGLRFGFFVVQIAAMIWMGIEIVGSAPGNVVK